MANAHAVDIGEEIKASGHGAGSFHVIGDSA
jgi:hypothetical protein